MKRCLLAGAGIVLVLLGGAAHGLWSNRWGDSQTLDTAVRQLDQVPQVIGDWTGRDLDMDPRALKIGEIAGCVHRQYLNRLTGQAVTVLLVCGKSGPIAVHTPDVCYAGAGYVLTAPPARQTIAPTGEAEPAQFWVAKLRKPDATAAVALRVYWSWNASGGWESPDNPRLRFGRYAMLYKLYVVRELGPHEEESVPGPDLAFLQHLVSELQRALQPVVSPRVATHHRSPLSPGIPGERGENPRDRKTEQRMTPSLPSPCQNLDLPIRPNWKTPDRAAMTDWYSAVKPLLDRLLALAVLVLAAPVVLLVAVAVKLTSRGPVFYSQVRLGQYGRPYRIYKIRSMIHDCERASGARWCVPGDSRVTPIGRFLRKTHIDELPQLWNILKGEMSLIGPRPERPEFVPQLEEALPHYRARLAVRPGVSGLAQVFLPPDTDLASVQQKLAYDLVYLQHVSLWLDLRIAVCTALYLLGVPFAVSRRLFRLPRPQGTESAYEIALSEAAAVA